MTSFEIFENDTSSTFLSDNETYSFDDKVSPSFFFFQLPEPYRTIETVNRKYILFVVLIASFVGNSLIIIILGQKHNRNYTTSVYFTALAVSDLMIAAGAFVSWYDYIWPLQMSVAICRTLFILTDIAYFTNPWVMCAISIERAISVYKPHKVKTFCTVKRARSITILLWLFLMVVFGSYRQIISSRRFQGVGDMECMTPLRYRFFIYFYNFIYFAFQIIIPYVILVTSTTLILLVLFKESVQKSTSGKRQRREVTRKLLFVNFAFFILVTPAVVQEMYQFFYQAFLDSYYSFETFLMQNLLLNIFRTMRVINSSINFFIYFFSGSRFRKETINLLKYGCSKTQSQH